MSISLTPGIHFGVSFEDYLAIDALSASAIQTLLTSFPARLLHRRPATQALDDGRIAHRLVLEGVDDIEDSSRYVVVPSGFSMKHVNKHADLIAEIQARGAEPISIDRSEAIHGMLDALKRDPEIIKALSNGDPEVTAIWEDEETGVLAKARFDWWPKTGAIISDYKTAASIDDDALSRAVHNYGLAHRSAWYSDAARVAGGRGDEEKPPIYLMIFQEKSPPYFATMRYVDPRHVDLARAEISMAKHLWKYCKESGQWPGPAHFKTVELPAWYVRRLEEQVGEPAADWSDAA